MDELTLADMRKKAGLTQQKVAERMGVSRGQVQRYEVLYPDISFVAVRRYIEAVGGRVLFKQWREDAVNAASVVQDPASAARREQYRNDPGRFAGRA